MVHVVQKEQHIPTYPPKPPHELPMFFEHKPYQGAAGRLYPIPYSDGITDQKVDRAYTVYELENEYIRTTLLPEIGGKLLRAYDKIGEYDFIYYNEVVKPALVGLAGAWISGGIEFNWPQHHRPTTFLPLESAVETTPDGKTVWMGEVDPLNRMKGMVGISLDEGRSYIKAKVRLYNRTPEARPFMWWANLAVPANDQYRTIFPPDCEWVNDHDRRAVLSWPIAKGVYQTARPFDFGEGTDISRYDAIKVPSSYLISQGQSDMDFIAGYDEGRQMGVATVADHHIAPGKKMWHWGKGDFGEMWCSNLTDRNGPYIELMTGVYTDNQPDFTWLAPYESREFEQYWYPIRDIGDVKNATIDAAMNMTQDGDCIKLAFITTGSFPGAQIVAEAGGTRFFTETVDLTPAASYSCSVPLGSVDFGDVTASLCDAAGRVLVSYKPVRRGQKQPIDVRKPVRRPAEIETVEELYINGYHLEQYKQHNYDPADYYREGLRRDPGDIRCNTSMARLALRCGRFDACTSYCDAAIRRLTSRNQHPTDTEAFYLKGVAQIYLGQYDAAYDILYRAAWNYTHRSAAYYLLAVLDCRKGAYADALKKLELSYGLNAGHTKARNLKAAILRRLKRPEAAALAAENIAFDPLDCFAAAEAAHAPKFRDGLAVFAQKPENLLDVARDYLMAGMADDALELLAQADDPLSHYYKAYAQAQLGQDPAAELAAAEAANTGYCFPAQLMDIPVLQFAIARHSGANAPYYLGCLFFDRSRYDEAIDCFEACIRMNPAHAKALRNLALLYFDRKHDAAAARICMEAALKYRRDPRLLLEYQQLLKNSNVSTDERLAVYAQYPDLLAERDDCFLDRIVLLCMKGQYADAIAAARGKRFHIYEGGEGKLTKLHAWMHVLYALECRAQGDLTKAERLLDDAIHMPKTYGEAKTFFNQEGHIYYVLGLLKEQQGDDRAAQAAFETASVYKAAVSELSLFRAMALRKLLRFSEAENVLREMLDRADSLIENCDLRSYYGVGSPSPMPFEDDIRKQNRLDGHLLRAYALLGLGQKTEADREIREAAQQDPNDFRIYTYRCIRDL